MMEKGNSKAERTRQFIIASTADIFNKKGFAGTSMSDITEATKLTKGSIYGNFENKEAVALAVFDYNLNKVQKAIQLKLNKAANNYDKVIAYIEVYDRFNKGAFPKGGCPVLNTAIDSDDTNAQLKDRAAKAIQNWKNGLQRLIKDGIATGEFKPDTDDNRIALSIIALIEGGVMISKVTDSQSNLDAVMQTAVLVIAQMKN